MKVVISLYDEFNRQFKRLAKNIHRPRHLPLH